MVKKVLEIKEKRRLLSTKNKDLKRTKKAKQEQYSKTNFGINLKS